MSISIVIVTYNSSTKIPKLLKSIANQNYQEKIQVIIIDNNSRDKSELKKYLDNIDKSSISFSLVTKYRNINNGFGNSCNYGSRFSTHKYILFLNPDTLLYKNSLSKLFIHASKNNADLIGGKSVTFSLKNIHRTVFNIPTIRTMFFEFSNLGKLFNISSNFYLNQSNINDDCEVSGVGGAYLMITKKSFTLLHGFDEKIFMYLEDVDLCKRAQDMQLKIIYCPHSIIRHIGGASSDNKYKIAHKAWFDSRKYYANKHFRKLINIFIQPIYSIEAYLLTHLKHL